jgi:hypothetical protein
MSSYTGFGNKDSREEKMVSGKLEEEFISPVNW